MKSPSSQFGKRFGQILLFLLVFIFTLSGLSESFGTDLTWIKGGTGTWKEGSGNGGSNWEDRYGNILDFLAEDTAIFDTASTSTLSGAINPTEIKITDGTTTLSGDGYIRNGSIYIGPDARLNLQNTTANTFTGGITIAADGSLHADRFSSLGSGSISNYGLTYLYDYNSENVLANKLEGTGNYYIYGNGSLYLTADSSGTGDLTTARDLVFGSANGKGTTGSFAGDIMAPNVSLNRSGTWDYAGTISKFPVGSTTAGALSVNNSQATMILRGTSGLDNTLVKAGTLSIQGGRLTANKETIVSNGATLQLYAAPTQNTAAIQGGKLTVEKGGTLSANIDYADNYNLNVGQSTSVYFGNNITSYSNASGSTPDFNSHPLFGLGSSDLQLTTTDGQLLMNVIRTDARETYTMLSDAVADSLNTYRGGNPQLENLFGWDDSDTVGGYLQNAYDFLNLSGAASAMYETHQAISSVLHQRLIDGHVLPRSYAQPAPCPPNNYYRGQCAPKSIARYTPSSLITATTTTLPTGPVCEVWVSPLYQNTKGFGLYSGSSRYGYKHNMGGIAAGLDRTDGALRYGVMGVGGGGKIESNGDVAPTKNDTGFGGVYGYLNERFHGANFFVQGGWTGMQNKISQNNDLGSMSGKMNSGLFSIGGTLSQMFCFDGLHLTATVGVEYGYYYQDSLTPSVNGDQINLDYGKGKANIWMLPVGVRLSREFSLDRCGVLTPELHAKYIWNFGNTGVGYDAWTSGVESAAPMFAYMVDRNNCDVGAGLGWFNDHWSLRGDYSFIWSKHRQSNLFSITGAYKF